MNLFIVQNVGSVVKVIDVHADTCSLVINRAAVYGLHLVYFKKDSYHICKVSTHPSFQSAGDTARSLKYQIEELDNETLFPNASVIRCSRGFIHEAHWAVYDHEKKSFIEYIKDGLEKVSIKQIDAYEFLVREAKNILQVREYADSLPDDTGRHY
jgi:hypothetical protein